MRLENWGLVNGTLYGEVYNDERGKWEDGHLIRTSRVQSKLSSLKEGYAVRTKNSTYILGKQA